MLRKRRPNPWLPKAEARLFTSRAFVRFAEHHSHDVLLVINLYGIQVNQYQDGFRSNDNRIKSSANRTKPRFDLRSKRCTSCREPSGFNLKSPRKNQRYGRYTCPSTRVSEIPPERIERFNRQATVIHDALNQYPILNQLTEEQVAVFSVNQHKFQCWGYRYLKKRFYPYGDVLTHVIGYVSRINDRDMQRLVREKKTPITKQPVISASWVSELLRICYTAQPATKLKSTAAGEWFAR